MKLIFTLEVEGTADDDVILLLVSVLVELAGANELRSLEEDGKPADDVTLKLLLAVPVLLELETVAELIILELAADVNPPKEVVMLESELDCVEEMEEDGILLAEDTVVRLELEAVS